MKAAYGPPLLALAISHADFGHACGSESIDITKRLLIRGEGELGETRLDQRANSPAFRISRNCVLENIDVDMTGFREAILIEGPASLQPLIQNCIIRYEVSDDVDPGDLCGQKVQTLCEYRCFAC